MRLGITAPEFWLEREQWPLDLLTLHNLGLSSLELAPHPALLDNFKWRYILRHLQALNMGITAHSPDFYDPTGFGLAGFRQMKKKQDNYIRLIEHLSDVQQSGMVLTVHSPDVNADDPSQALDDTLFFCDFALERIEVTSSPIQIALETLRPPAYGSSAQELLHVCNQFTDNRLGICLDVVHARDWSFDQALIHAVKTVHIHGFDGKEDHLSLAKHPPKRLELLYETLKAHEACTVTIELLNVADGDFSVAIQRDLDWMMNHLEEK